MTSTKSQINYILTQQRHEITGKERKGKQYLFHFPLASLTWAPTPSLEPEEAWFLWLDSEHHDTGKCALNLDSCDIGTVRFPLAGTTSPRAHTDCVMTL